MNKLEKIIQERHLVEHLIESLHLLAANSDVQMSSLPDFVHVPDELALIYTDCLHLVEPFVGHKQLTHVIWQQLLALDNLLEHMSLQKDLWSIQALVNDAHWQEVRLQAQAILRLFEEKPRAPNLSWLSYVPDLKR